MTTVERVVALEQSQTDITRVLEEQSSALKRLDNKVDRLDDKIDRLDSKIAGSLAALDNKADGLDGRMAHMNKDLEEGLDRVSSDMRSLAGWTEGQFEVLGNRVEKVEEKTDQIYAFLVKKFGEAEV